MKTKKAIQNFIMYTFVLIVLLYSFDQDTNIKVISGSIDMEVIL